MAAATEPPEARAGRKSGRPPRGGHGRCLVWFLSWTALVGAGLDAGFDRWHQAQSGERRNPHFRRAWPEHTRAAPRQPGERLVILISNSQGYGREVEDSATYASRLEPALAARLGAPVRVLNWSVPAGAGPDFVVLGAAAMRLEPDVLLLVAAAGNFGPSPLRIDGRDPRRQAWPSDSRDLLAEAEVRRRVPRRFLAQYVLPIDGVDWILGRTFGPWSYRDLPTAWLMRFPVFRPFQASPEVETWFYQRDKPANPPRAAYPAVPVDWDLVHAYLEATAGGAHIRRMLVLMPLHRLREDRGGPVFASLRAAAQAAGVEAYDFSEVLEEERFFVTAHVDAEGHRLIAERLAEVIAP